MDFNTFVNAKTNHQCTSVDKCQSVDRVIAGLVYYQTLNNTKNENSNGQIIFTQFLLDIYKNYLNDINHIIIIHDKDLEIINQLLLKQSHIISCNVDKCLLSDRHCKINDGKNGNVNINEAKIDPLTQFHQETWDNVHFYLTHLFDLGLRQKTQLEEEEEYVEEKKEDDEWGCFDKQFKMQRMMIQATRKKFPRFSARFQPTSNKFKTATVSKSEQKNQYSTVEGIKYVSVFIF